MTLCKDASGKLGIWRQAINKGMFVCLVMKGFPDASPGIWFGSEIIFSRTVVLLLPVSPWTRSIPCSMNVQSVRFLLWFKTGMYTLCIYKIKSDLNKLSRTVPEKVFLLSGVQSIVT